MPLPASDSLCSSTSCAQEPSAGDVKEGTNPPKRSHLRPCLHKLLCRIRAPPMWATCQALVSSGCASRSCTECSACSSSRQHGPLANSGRSCRSCTHLQEAAALPPPVPGPSTTGPLSPQHVPATGPLPPQNPPADPANLPTQDVPAHPAQQIAVPSPGTANMGPLQVPGPDVPTDHAQIALPSPVPPRGPLASARYRSCTDCSAVPGSPPTWAPCKCQVRTCLQILCRLLCRPGSRQHGPLASARSGRACRSCADCSAVPGSRQHGPLASARSGRACRSCADCSAVPQHGPPCKCQVRTSLQILCRLLCRPRVPANMGPLQVPGPDVPTDPVQIALPSPGPANMGPLPDPAQIALPLQGAANMGPLPALDGAGTIMPLHPNREGEVAQAEVADNAFFLASDHFKGAMQHCYFGTGKHGLGYYELKPAIAVLEEHPSLPGTQKWKALPCPKCYRQLNLKP